MKVLFIITECESYAVNLFSSLLKKNGHEVYLIFDPKLFDTDDLHNERLKKLFDIRENNLKKILAIKPDLIGFSVYTKDYIWSLEMAKMIKKVINVPIIFGGIHCILVPQEVIKSEYIDFVCIGEGEDALLELVNSMQIGEINYGIKNIWFKARDGQIRKNELRPLIDDLDSLPFPDRDIIVKQKPVLKKGYIISSGRGCPYRCTFCVSGAMNKFYAESGLGKYVRHRSVKNVIEELDWAMNKYSYKSINFTDDVFSLNINWLKEFSREYQKKIKVPFFCTANPGTIKDEELQLLKESNCHMIGFGLQSASEDTRKKTLNRVGDNKRIMEVAKLCHKLKIIFSFDHIFNIPGEDEKEQVEALQFYNNTRPHAIHTFWMTYFPKTKITDIALEKGMLNHEDVNKINKGEASTSLRIGAGCDYSFNKKDMFDTFAFLFSALPLMPPWLVKRIIRKYWYRRKISFPFLFRLALKDIARLKSGRFEDVFFPMRLLVANIIDNLKIKYVPTKLINKI